METQHFVSEFIEQAWNNRNFEQLSCFLHPEFHDHSLPSPFSPDAEGMKKWIQATSASFEHQTIIEDQVTEGDKCIIKIRMELKHIGPWRGFEATGMDINTIGYRYYKLKEGRIAEHWALIDGQSIENQITNAAHGCKIAH